MRREGVGSDKRLWLEEGGIQVKIGSVEVAAARRRRTA
jgi:hypothetical protein